MGINTQSVICSCRKTRSKYEIEISDWLKSLNISNIITHKWLAEGKKSKLECDIYLPEYNNFGIEFHGLWWHCDSVKPEPTYHQNKYLYFKKHNINIIQIFENEWLTKQEIVKSIIKNRLKLNQKVPARKCELKEVSYFESQDFLYKNHLQGKCAGKTNIGLYYKNELVALGVFSTSRFQKENAIELLRFCNKINITVVGGFQRILKYYVNAYKPNKIISFCDLRYFDGSGYIKNGFTLVKITQPDYFYFKDGSYTLEHRTKYQKHKLKDLLAVFNSEYTEYENMIINKYRRIFDAGNLKLEYTPTT